ncbi:MAG: SPOR domain-containing protein, partial [Burkholderiales bacterium]|nr:SPOR domain-containing protein [Burkholderiales bacterium]
QLGPFKDRAEADRASARLHDLGVKGLVVQQPK